MRSRGFMEFSLFDNGVDSLKKANDSIKRFEELHQEYAYHHLKDSIIFLNHAIEILFKYMLSNRHEVLLFEDDKKYFAAKEQLFNERKGFAPFNPGEGFGNNQNLLYSVFDVAKGKGLHTITLMEAMNRVQYVCEVPVSEDFRGAIEYIKDYRNKIMHHSIKVERLEMDKLISEIKFTYQIAVNFFESHIPGTMKLIDQEMFELTQQEYEENQRAMEDYYHERAMSKII